MADRRLYTSSFGHPGRLEYLPFGASRAEECGWQTARNHDPNAPRFREIGSRQEWFEASQIPVSVSSEESWHRTRNQTTWLLKNHPEAALGNDVIGEILAAETSSYRHGHIPAWKLTQLVVGEMTDTSDPNGVSSAPLIAMAAGSGGDVLRLVRPGVNGWQLEDDESATLQLFDYADHHETLWTKDIGTIRRIKPIVSTKRFEPLRWLIVQRESGTSVFAPEYQYIPVVSDVFPGSRPRQASHIAPSLLFTLQKQQTGYASHSDAAVNPGAKKKPAQLAVIDESGYWTIWEITGTRNKANRHAKTSLVKCGSIQKGVRKRLSYKQAANLQCHRIFFVGGSPDTAGDFDNSDEEEAPILRTRSSFPPLARSSILLLCNSNLFRLLDLEKNVFLPDLSFVPEGSNEKILDVHDNSHDPYCFFVVTTSRLFMVGILPTTNVMEETIGKHAYILHTSPHMRDRFKMDLKLAVAPGPCSKKNRTSLVFLYGTESSWIDVFCFNVSKKHPEQVTCYRDTLTLGAFMGINTDFSLQTLCVSPVSVTGQPGKRITERGQSLIHQRARYFQLFTLGADLGLSCFLCMSSDNGWNEERFPLQKLDRRPTSRSERERLKVIRHLAPRFIIYDNLAGFRYGDEEADIDLVNTMTTRDDKRYLRFMKPLYERFQSTLQKIVEVNSGNSLDMEMFGAAPFDPLYIAVQTALETKTGPLKTFREIIKQIKLPEDVGEMSDEWRAEIEQLRCADPALQVMGLLIPQISQQDVPTLRELAADMASKFAEVDNSPEISDYQDEVKELIICQSACDLYLSLHGIMYRQPDAVDYQSSVPVDAASSANVTDGMIIDSQPGSRPATPTSAFPSVSAMSVSETSKEDQDAAMTLIQAYIGTGKANPPKPFKLSSGWTFGEKPSVVLEKDTEITPGMQKLQKKLEKEARKRKRAETFDQLRQEIMPASQSQPATNSRWHSQANQSLGEFSQSSGLRSSPPPQAMSQPVAGAFGNRLSIGHQKKRVKRKGGF